MARSRKMKKPPTSKPPRQGGKGPVYAQAPRPQGGKPKNTAARPAAKSTQMNTSMTKPGKGTRGSGRGAH
ncbi:MAG TPA: hypothetical protein VFS39_18400 [Nitrospira sp.]|nr:hypothetical protein [Nitrospira sp.]